jgi:hypothetical protein
MYKVLKIGITRILQMIKMYIFICKKFFPKGKIPNCLVGMLMQNSSDVINVLSGRYNHESNRYYYRCQIAAKSNMFSLFHNKGGMIRLKKRIQMHQYNLLVRAKCMRQGGKCSGHYYHNYFLLFLSDST